MCFTMLPPITYTRLVTSVLVSDGLVLMVLSFSSQSCTFFWFFSFFSSVLLAVLYFWFFFRICSNYVNVTFIFSKIVMKRPMNGILGSIIVSFGVFSAGVSLISILFFLGDFADGRSLHDAEVQSSMDLNFIFSKVLTT